MTAHPFSVTFFPPGLQALTKNQQTMTLPELAEVIRSTKARDKYKLPWLKLARFGMGRTREDCLRNDRNVIAVTGAVVDYDGEEISPQDAAERLDKAGIEAMIYTSASHTDAQPRWRIVVPFSKELKPDEHYHQVSRLNGLLGGILDPISYNLSQSYYYGSINGTPPEIIIVDGTQYLDQAHELDKTAIAKPNGGNGHDRQINTPETSAADLQAALELLPNDNLHWTEWNKIGMAAWRASGGLTEGLVAFDAWSKKSKKYNAAETQARWTHYYSTPPDHIGYGAIVHLVRDAIGDPKWLPSSRIKKIEPQPQPPIGQQKIDKPCNVSVRRASKFKAEKIHWLWRGWFARGKFHLLAGGKGAGKSTLAFDLLARMTTPGAAWPDGTPIEAPTDVMVWSGEDGIADTILPRFLAAGGNPDHLYFPVSTCGVDGQSRSFDPSLDMEGLVTAAGHYRNLGAVLIDPVVMVLPSRSDSHKNTETRRGLQPLVEFAEQRGIALIGITHFTKNTQDRDPVERVTGSLAFGALPRIIWGASADDDGTQRRLVRISSNIGPTGGGIEYTLFEAPLPDHDFSAQRVDWGKRLTGSARELLNAEKRSAEGSAEAWLRDLLAAGPQRQKDVKDAAEAHCHAWRTVERAKTKLGVVSYQEGKAWIWALPNQTANHRQAYDA
jgi:hypothetical protein